MEAVCSFTVISEQRGFWKVPDFKKGKRERKRCSEVGHTVDRSQERGQLEDGTEVILP